MLTENKYKKFIEDQQIDDESNIRLLERIKANSRKWGLFEESEKFQGAKSRDFKNHNKPNYPNNIEIISTRKQKHWPLAAMFVTAAAIVLLAGFSMFLWRYFTAKYSLPSLNNEFSESSITVENTGNAVSLGAKDTSQSDRLQVPKDYDLKGLEPLYIINPQENLKEGTVQDKNFTSAEIATIKEAFSDDYIKSPHHENLLEGKLGNLFMDESWFSYETPRWYGGLDSPGFGNSYQDTVRILLDSASDRRIWTYSQSEDFPFLSRAEARQKAEEFFVSIGLDNLILRSISSLRQAITGEPFYYLQFMHSLQGIPLADQAGMPFFQGRSLTGIYGEISCAIDEDGFAYVSVCNLNLQAGSNDISIIPREAMGRKIINEVLPQDNQLGVVDSLELFWGSNSPVEYENKYWKEGIQYRLTPYYLVVVRVPEFSPPDGGAGGRFIRWIFDAQTGERIDSLR